MPTTTTATLLLGYRDTGRFATFDPRMLLALREGRRASWLVHPLGRGGGIRRQVISAVTPETLLWTGLLGALCTAAPLELALYESLSRVVNRAPRGCEIDVLTADDVAAIAELSEAQLAGCLTLFPDASIGPDQWLHAERIGLSVARPSDVELGRTSR